MVPLQQTLLTLSHQNAVSVVNGNSPGIREKAGNCCKPFAVGMGLSTGCGKRVTVRSLQCSSRAGILTPGEKKHCRGSFCCYSKKEIKVFGAIAC